MKFSKISKDIGISEVMNNPNRKKRYKKSKRVHNIKVLIDDVKRCKTCNNTIVWLKSKKGKNYPVNFYGSTVMDSLDFHKCKNRDIFDNINNRG